MFFTDGSLIEIECAVSKLLNLGSNDTSLGNPGVVGRVLTFSVVVSVVNWKNWHFLYGFYSY